MIEIGLHLPPQDNEHSQELKQVRSQEQQRCGDCALRLRKLPDQAERRTSKD